MAARLLWVVLSISCLLQCTTEGGRGARRAGDDVMAFTEHEQNPAALTTAARLHAAAMRSGRRRMAAALDTDVLHTDARHRISLRDNERVEERNVATMRETDQSPLRQGRLGAEELTQAGKNADKALGKDTFLADHRARMASQQGFTQSPCFSDELHPRSSCWQLTCLKRTHLQLKATMKQTRPCEVVFLQMV